MKCSGKLLFTASACAVAFLCGCAGEYVEAGTYAEPYPYYDPLYVPAPDVYVFGGYRHPYHFHDRAFSHRGFESRHYGHPPAVGGIPRGAHGGPWSGGFRPSSPQRGSRGHR